jgi:hypothetical protein
MFQNFPANLRRIRLAPFFCALALLPAAARSDSLQTKRPELSKTVLIVKGGSYLERIVGGLLKDSLAVRGYAVTFTGPQSLKDAQPSDYRAIVVMNAVQASKLDATVRSYARTMGAERSKLLICTVYGEAWKSGKTLSDAVSAATTTLDPASIAAKIMNGFDSLTTVR